MPNITRRSILGIFAATPLVALASRVSAAGHAAHTVTIEGFAFSPATLDVAVGDTISFTNADSAPHTATALDGSFDTGRLNRNESGEITVTAAGSFEYKCNFHPAMRGTINVT